MLFRSPTPSLIPRRCRSPTLSLLPHRRLSPTPVSSYLHSQPPPQFPIYTTTVTQHHHHSFPPPPLSPPHPDPTPTPNRQKDEVPDQAASGTNPPKHVNGDGIISMIPYLQFAEGSEEHKRFKRLRKMNPEKNLGADRVFLKKVNVREFAEGIIGVITPWRRLFDIAHPAHWELTPELYSTLVVSPRATGQPEVQMLVPGVDHEQAEVKFSMFGVPRYMSMEELDMALGLYTRDDVTGPIYTQSVHEIAADE